MGLRAANPNTVPAAKKEYTTAVATWAIIFGFNVSDVENAKTEIIIEKCGRIQY
jgi:hypothetical protein